MISYHGSGLVNMSGVSVTNVRRFMSCVAIINTSISSVETQENGHGKDAKRSAESINRLVLGKTGFKSAAS